MTATDLATSLLNHPDAQIADAWNHALDAVEGVADSFQQFIDISGYVETERAYTTWALSALSTLTSYATTLSAAQLDELVASKAAHPNKLRKDLPTAKQGRLYFASSTADAVICTDRIARATKPDLDQLKSLGWPCYEAGLAVVTQGVVEPEVTDILAGPWVRCGHPFPRHESIAWTSPRWQGGRA